MHFSLKRANKRVIGRFKSSYVVEGLIAAARAVKIESESLKAHIKMVCRKDTIASVPSHASL